MSAPDRKVWGETWPTEVLILNGSLVPVTGSTTILMSIRRKSDDQYYDFADGEFKSSEWGTRETQMGEVDGTYSPGQYKYDWPTSSVVDQEDNDLYVFTVRDSAGEAGAPYYVSEIQATDSLKQLLALLGAVLDLAP